MAAVSTDGVVVVAAAAAAAAVLEDNTKAIFCIFIGFFWLPG
jgi:hypothetical protein